MASDAGLLDLGLIIAFLAMDLAVVVVFILLRTVTGRGALRASLYNKCDFWWCLPTGELPNRSSKALDFECRLLPFAAWLTSAIQSS